MVLSRGKGLCSNLTSKPVSMSTKSCVLVYFDLLSLSDLTSLFDWNTKQLFVMLIAHYKTKRNV